MNGKQLLFVHVPKTAGTTINELYFPGAYGKSNCYMVRGRPEQNAADLAKFRAKTKAERDAYSVVLGHNSHRLLDILADPVRTAVVRSPEAQIQSMYFHSLTHDAEAIEAERIKDEGLTLSAYSRLTWNPQVQALDGDGVRDIERIASAYDLIGITESLDRFVFLLHLLYDVPLVLFGRRMVNDRSKTYKMSRRERRTIARNNPLDIALYDLVRERFERTYSETVGPAEQRLFTKYADALVSYREALPTDEESRIGDLWEEAPTRSDGWVGRVADRLRDDQQRQRVSVPDEPLISFVTTCYQSRDFLERCLDSVAAQTYPHVEHIVQDAASEDGTIELLEAATHRVDWRSEPDSGETEGLNRALQRIKGDYFLVLNADDEVLSHAAEWLVAQITKHPDAGCIFGDQYLIDANDEVIGLVYGPDDCSYAGIVCGEHVPPAQAAFIRTDAMRDVGMWADTTLETCPDHEMWVRLGARYGIVHEPGLITFYRWHNDGKGRQSDIVDQMVTDKNAVNQRLWDDPAVDPSIRALESRANSSMRMWAASMCIDAGDPVKAARYVLRAARPLPSMHWWHKAVGEFAHWRFRRRHLQYRSVTS